MPLKVAILANQSHITSPIPSYLRCNENSKNPCFIPNANHSRTAKNCPFSIKTARFPAKTPKFLEKTGLKFKKQQYEKCDYMPF